MTEKELKDSFYKNPKGFALWAKLCGSRKCLWCSCEFPEGIITPNPKEIVHLKDSFRADFLVHSKTTHGYDPELIENMVKMSNKTQF